MAKHFHFEIEEITVLTKRYSSYDGSGDDDTESYFQIVAHSCGEEWVFQYEFVTRDQAERAVRGLVAFHDNPETDKRDWQKVSNTVAA